MKDVKQDIPDLEKLFEVNVFVYSLDSTTVDGEDGEEESREEEKSLKSRPS